MKTTRNRIRSAKPVIFKLVLLAGALIVLMFSSVAPALAQATTVTDIIDITIVTSVFVPCAVGGEGEVVFLTGTLHGVLVTTIDANGAFHTRAHFQSQGISGEGLTTGDRYRWTGATQASFNGLVGFENTFINNFRVIGQGAGNNLLIHQTFHVEAQPDGELRILVDRYSVECR